MFTATLKTRIHDRFEMSCMPEQDLHLPERTATPVLGVAHRGIHVALTSQVTLCSELRYPAQSSLLFCI